MENTAEIRDLVQAVLKARKIAKIYPAGNQTYIRTIDAVCKKFSEVFESTEEITLHIKQGEVLCEGEQVDYNPERHDNLALLLYKDGLRELTFRRDLSREEVESFLKVIACDEKELIDIDMVTLLWEEDFQHIKYVIDESILTDDETYDPSIEKRDVEEPTESEELFDAYRDACSAEYVEPVEIAPLSPADLHDLMMEFERDVEVKSYKLVNIIFELCYQTKDSVECKEIASILEAMMDFFISNNDITSIVDVLKKINLLLEDSQIPPAMRVFLSGMVNYAGSPEIIRGVGTLLDSGEGIDENALDEFVSYLGANAIQPFIDVLGGLQKISARRRIISILALLGPKDVGTLFEGLSDNRWYVVRNLVCVARAIGDKRAIGPLVDALSYPEARVRREVISTLGEMRASQALPALQQCLDDADQQIRIATVRALRHMRTEEVKYLLMRRIREDTFIDKKYEEKRCFFECLSAWKDKEVADFLADMLRKRGVVKRKKNYESRACAAYALGMTGDEGHIAFLRKYEESGNELLKEHVQEAIRKLADENE